MSNRNGAGPYIIWSRVIRLEPGCTGRGIICGVCLVARPMFWESTMNRVLVGSNDEEELERRHVKMLENIVIILSKN